MHRLRQAVVLHSEGTEPTPHLVRRSRSDPRELPAEGRQEHRADDHHGLRMPTLRGGTRLALEDDQVDAETWSSAPDEVHQGVLRVRWRRSGELNEVSDLPDHAEWPPRRAGRSGSGPMSSTPQLAGHEIPRHGVELRHQQGQHPLMSAQARPGGESRRTSSSQVPQTDSE